MTGATKRLSAVVLLAAAIGAWWIADHHVVPWVQRVTGYDRISGADGLDFGPATAWVVVFLDRCVSG